MGKRARRKHRSGRRPVAVGPAGSKARSLITMESGPPDATIPEKPADTEGRLETQGAGAALSRNALASIFGRLLYVVTRVGLPPLILHFVSVEAYGIWATCFVLIRHIGMDALLCVQRLYSLRCRIRPRSPSLNFAGFLMYGNIREKAWRHSSRATACHQKAHRPITGIGLSATIY